jgi:hypothetical protein
MVDLPWDMPTAEQLAAAQPTTVRYLSVGGGDWYRQNEDGTSTLMGDEMTWTVVGPDGQPVTGAVTIEGRLSTGENDQPTA